MTLAKVRVREKDGYTIFYDSERKLFCLEDAMGNEVATASTQDKAEAEIQGIAKQAFKLPMPAILTRSYGIDRGRITSLNLHAETAYFSYDNKARGSTQKIALRYDREVYVLTEANEQIAKQIEERMAQRAKLSEEIEALKGQFEKPINAEYFTVLGDS